MLMYSPVHTCLINLGLFLRSSFLDDLSKKIRRPTFNETLVNCGLPKKNKYC